MATPQPRNDDDWSNNQSLLDCNINMYDNQVNTDIQFDVKTPDGKSEGTIGAHKYILMSRSAVFMAMFSNDFRESSTGRITIDDVPLDSFKLFLRYLYTDQMQMEENDASVMHFLLYAAKKYMVTTLVEKCVKYLETQVQPSNACTILEQSLLYEEKELEKLCIHVIQHATDESMGNESSFDQIGPDTVKVILKWDHLSASEISIYENVLRWSVAQCKKRGFKEIARNQRKVMAGIIPLIRFPCMSQENFTNKISKSGILKDAEELNIFRYYKSTEPETNFSTEKRLEPPLVKCMFLPSVSKSQPFTNGIACTVEVSITRPIKLHSFYITGLSNVNYGSLSAINVNIVQNSNTLYIGPASVEVQNLADPPMLVYYCKLPSPAKIANGLFQITATYALISNQPYGHLNPATANASYGDMAASLALLSNRSYAYQPPILNPKPTTANASYGDIITEKKNTDITTFQCKLVAGHCHLVGFECTLNY